MDNSLITNANRYLTAISKINDFVDSEVLRYIHSGDKDLIKEALKKNRIANELLREFENGQCNNSLDKFLSFWVYECAGVFEFDRITQSKLFNKFDFFYRSVGKNPTTDPSFSFSIITRLLQELSTKFSYYVTEDDSVVIVTAVPEEFKAMFRKIAFIIAVSDKDLLEMVLHPDSSKQEVDKRKKGIWIQCVIERNNKWVKVIIILPNEYGSTAASEYITTFKPDYYFRNEILLVGIAGQLDEKDHVKIGHIVISDGYYNAYKLKFTEDPNRNIYQSIDYSQTNPIQLDSEYDSDAFCWNKWEPKYLIQTPPAIKNSSRESCKVEVHKGKFVSIPGVNKQNYNKQKLRATFTNSLAVEMEAYGCYKFIENKKNMKFKIIKSICDWSDNTKEKEWQPYCADIAAEFAVDYIIGKYGKELK